MIKLLTFIMALVIGFCAGRLCASEREYVRRYQNERALVLSSVSQLVANRAFAQQYPALYDRLIVFLMLPPITLGLQGQASQDPRIYEQFTEFVIRAHALS